MLKFLSLLLLVSISYAYSGIIKDNKYFQKLGQQASFQWAPDYYDQKFLYDIYYYIPKTLESREGVPTLVFLHGGGGSTMTREGSSRVARSYLSDLVSLADELGFVLVMPSGSGLNWGGHMRWMLKSLNALVRKDLNVDPNRVGLSGHSMGGMGITRTFNWITDEYSFFMPLSAGMKESTQVEASLLPLFNTVYVHQQGLQDHFNVFVTDTKAQEAKMLELEKKLNKKSGFRAIFYEGSHNYQKPLMKTSLTDLFKLKRDFYQNEIYSSFLNIDRVENYNNINYQVPSIAHSFWLQAIEFQNNEKTIRSDVRGKIIKEQNKVIIQLMSGHNLKKIRVYLSQKMLDLTKKVTIVINGIPVYKKVTPVHKMSFQKEMGVVERKDPSFQFERYVDVEIPKIALIF